eukprot:TRINITY_DN9567_c0_g2_i2.p1 TRINITY_DN9567_c0_g2~~TRINITY_DN9567_c0_g2_i2.p1  ORF type:complete len:109 (+),score=10.99 TRINITY_DN9567_c0_g2_i2:267-593(+)
MTEIPIFDKRTLSPPLYQPISKKGLTLESMTNDFSEFASIWSEPLGKPIPLYIEHRPSPFSNIHFPFHSVLSFHWFGYQSESVFCTNKDTNLTKNKNRDELKFRLFFV